MKNSLKRIVVDAPEDVEGMGVDLFSYALGSLKHAMHLGPKTCTVERRECRAGCGCKATYEADLDRVRKMYRPFLQKHKYEVLHSMSPITTCVQKQTQSF